MKVWRSYHVTKLLWRSYHVAKLLATFTTSLLDAQHKRDIVENKPASLLVVPLGKVLSRITHLGVVEKWLATPKRACTAHRWLSRDRRINIQQKKKQYMIFLRFAIIRRLQTCSSIFHL